MSKRKKAAHGGAREGAGRKASLKRPIKVLVTLEGGQARKLAKLCKRTGQNRSAAVRELIDTNIKEESDDDARLQLEGNAPAIGGANGT